MTVKLSISLTDQQAEYARKQVAEGRASSTSAVIQQALEAKRREDEEFEARKDGFFGLLAERAKGPHVDADTFGTMVDEMLTAERARLGLDD